MTIHQKSKVRPNVISQDTFFIILVKSLAVKQSVLLKNSEGTIIVQSQGGPGGNGGEGGRGSDGKNETDTQEHTLAGRGGTGGDGGNGGNGGQVCIYTDTLGLLSLSRIIIENGGGSGGKGGLGGKSGTNGSSKPATKIGAIFNLFGLLGRAVSQAADLNRAASGRNGYPGKTGGDPEIMIMTSDNIAQILLNY